MKIRAKEPMKYVAIAAPTIITTFSIAFFFMLMPESTAVKIPEKNETITAALTAIMAALNEESGITRGMKNGITAGNAPRI